MREPSCFTICCSGAVVDLPTINSTCSDHTRLTSSRAHSQFVDECGSRPLTSIRLKSWRQLRRNAQRKAQSRELMAVGMPLGVAATRKPFDPIGIAASKPGCNHLDCLQ